MNKNSSFSVAGVIDVRVERFTNSVSEQERATRVQLSDGFIWNLAGAAKTKVMRITTSSLNFEHTRQSCHSLIIEMQFRFNKKEKKSQVGITGRLISISIV